MFFLQRRRGEEKVKLGILLDSGTVNPDTHFKGSERHARTEHSMKPKNAAKTETAATPASDQTIGPNEDFDPMEIRSRMIQPLVEVVDGCPDSKLLRLIAHLALMNLDRGVFIDAQVKKNGRSAAGLVTATAAKFSA